MHSTAPTVSEYIAALPDDRFHIVETVRQVILANLDGGYSENMQYGMIGYAVPHSRFPAGYHCDPTLPSPFAGRYSRPCRERAAKKLRQSRRREPGLRVRNEYQEYHGAAGQQHCLQRKDEHRYAEMFRNFHGASLQGLTPG
ncbi:MAG: hypothetical protein JWR65_2020 [Massilia sp.]|jgi:hypothetical protein|nr:hypothetical protein [Massilia sp.]